MLCGVGEWWWWLWAAAGAWWSETWWSVCCVVLYSETVLGWWNGFGGKAGVRETEVCGEGQTDDGSAMEICDDWGLDSIGMDLIGWKRG